MMFLPINVLFFETFLPCVLVAGDPTSASSKITIGATNILESKSKITRSTTAQRVLQQASEYLLDLQSAVLILGQQLVIERSASPS